MQSARRTPASLPYRAKLSRSREEPDALPMFSLMVRTSIAVCVCSDDDMPPAGVRATCHVRAADPGRLHVCGHVCTALTASIQRGDAGHGFSNVVHARIALCISKLDGATIELLCSEALHGLSRTLALPPCTHPPAT